MFSSFFIMSQSLVGLNRPKDRFVHAWTRSALAVTLAAGGVLMSAENAFALPTDLPCPSPFNNPAPVNFIVTN
ncbi:MAG: hypothetical protein ACK587_15905, partial [Cyanobacteriota bacterium]